MIVKLLLPLILAFIMFSLGLGLSGRDFTRVLRFPVAFGTGLLNQVLLLPLVALGLAHAFGLPAVFAAGLMIIALCPGGVTSNLLARLAGGKRGAGMFGCRTPFFILKRTLCILGAAQNSHDAFAGAIP